MATQKSDITFTVELDDKKVPERISWHATDAGDMKPQECRSIMLSIWDHQEQNTLRIDLWTKEMRVDEMDNHFLQSLLLMSESYGKATNNPWVADEMKNFCASLVKKISERERAKQQQG